jgi:hypothetical protein
MSNEIARIIKKVGRWGRIRVVPLDKMTYRYLDVTFGDYVTISFEEDGIKIRKLGIRAPEKGVEVQRERIPA